MVESSDLHQGVWLRNAEPLVRRHARTLLGQRWRKSHVDGLLYDLRADRIHITDVQPTQWINCRNGLLDWRTGRLAEHTPKVPSTYQLAVDWNPKAKCPTIDEWLSKVIPADCINLVWEVIGTAIYPDQPFHRAILLLGPGRNGKGTLLRLIINLIGKAHVSSVTLQQMGEDRFAAASLFGKVANIAGDLDARAITRTDLFKMATGGDLIRAEEKYGQPYNFFNRATFLFSANEPPGTADHSDGFFSRWVVIPFNRLHLTPEQEDSTIETKMAAELDGALVRAVAGLKRAIGRHGYDRPRSVIEASDGYRQNSDPIRRFLAERYTITGAYDDRLNRHDIYGKYKEWCDENGHKPMSTQRFWPHVAGVDSRITLVNDEGQPWKTAGVRLVRGIQIQGPTDGAEGAVATIPSPAHGGKNVKPDPSAPSADPEVF